jgi:hypothetical protein
MRTAGAAVLGRSAVSGILFPDQPTPAPNAVGKIIES